jgi:hypothetical protein
MSTDPINTMPIQTFIQQVQNADNSRAREVKLDIIAAKNLAFTLGVIMGRLEGDLEKFVKENASNNNGDDTININMDSGNW